MYQNNNKSDLSLLFLFELPKGLPEARLALRKLKGPFFPFLPASSGDPWAKPKVLYHQFDSLPRHWCPPAGSWVASTTGTNDLLTKALSICLHNGSFEHGPFGFNVPNLHLDEWEVLPEVGNEDPVDFRHPIRKHHPGSDKAGKVMVHFLYSISTDVFWIIQRLGWSL